MRKMMLWFIIGGMSYYAIEGFWHLFSNDGWANISMLIVGGLCFVIIGRINNIPAFYNTSIRTQSIIGTFIALTVEFISGIILNRVLGMNVWDYSSMPFNIMGQVCLLYGVFWFFLIPFGIWLEDRLNVIWYAYMLYRGKKIENMKIYDYTLIDAYAELIFG